MCKDYTTQKKHAHYWHIKRYNVLKEFPKMYQAILHFVQTSHFILSFAVFVFRLTAFFPSPYHPNPYFHPTFTQLRAKRLSNVAALCKSYCYIKYDSHRVKHRWDIIPTTELFIGGMFTTSRWELDITTLLHAIEPVASCDILFRPFKTGDEVVASHSSSAAMKKL